MPNKDSFTFSDKLKKSKSLPLSKRIPSRVGGDGKAKRTLIQRAQRDLPFILVAAAALLLLPILSRDSGVEYDRYGGGDFIDFPDGSRAAGDFGTGLGITPDMAPTSGFRDPLSLIIRKSGEDAMGERAMAEIPDEEDERPMTRTRPTTFGSIPESKPRPTETFAPAAKGGIRAGVVREPTKIAALRQSKTIGGAGNTGAVRTLLIGAGPQGAGGTFIRDAVRPVALQPMESAGRGGRSLTGENLYAEAARSIGAMNRGPSKQGLFDAQLRNVDGSPLGPTVGGAPFSGPGSRPGMGGGPSNNMSHKPQLPWWWDFEKQKIMKMWELWNYNFQKAASDAIIKVATGLALCLATGSEDGSVKNFLGKMGGDVDFDCCTECNADGTCKGTNYGSASDFGGITSSTTGSGDNKTTSNNAYDAFERFCTAKQGKMCKSETKKKGFFDVRSRCLGLKWKDSWLGKLFKQNKWDADCTGVDNGTGIYAFELTHSKKGAWRDKSVGHYVTAVCLDKSCTDASAAKDEKVIYAAAGPSLDGKKLKVRMDAIRNAGGTGVAITKIVGFKAQFAVADDIYLKSDQAGQQPRQKDESTGKKIKGKDGKGENLKPNSTGEGSMEINKLVGKITDTDFLEESELQQVIGVGFRLLKSCSVSKDFLGTAFDPLKIATATKHAEGIDCTSENAQLGFEPYDMLSKRTFSATIKNPGLCVFAVLVEASGVAEDNYVVKRVFEYRPDPNKTFGSGREFMNCVVKKTVDNKDVTKTAAYGKTAELECKFVAGIAYDETSTVKDGVKAEIANNGNGWVYWITTNECDKPDLVKKKTDLGNKFTMQQILGRTSLGGQRYGTCYYSWGCVENNGCAAAGEFCHDEGQLYAYTVEKEIKLRIGNPVSKSSSAVKEFVKKRGADYKETEGSCEACVDAAIASGKIEPCPKICKEAEDKYRNEGKPEVTFTEEELKKVGFDITKCKACNPEQPGKDPNTTQVKKGHALCNYPLFATFQVNEHNIGQSNVAKCSTCSKERMYASNTITKSGKIITAGTRYDMTMDPQYDGLLDCIRTNKVPMSLIVDGHASKDRANDHLNQPLSEARAITAAKLLAERIRTDLSDSKNRQNADIKGALVVLNDVGSNLTGRDAQVAAAFKAALNGLKIAPSVFIQTSISMPAAGNGQALAGRTSVSISQSSDGFINPSYKMEDSAGQKEIAEVLRLGTELIIKQNHITKEQSGALSAKVNELYNRSKTTTAPTVDELSGFLNAVKALETQDAAKKLQTDMNSPVIIVAATSIVNLYNIVGFSQQRIEIVVQAFGSTVPKAGSTDPYSAENQRIEVNAQSIADLEDKFNKLLPDFGKLEYGQPRPPQDMSKLPPAGSGVLAPEEEASKGNNPFTITPLKFN